MVFTGFTVSYLVFQIGTLLTTGAFGPGFLPGLVVVAGIALFIAHQIRKTNRTLAAERKQTAMK